MLLSVVPPLCATLSYFPLWRRMGSTPLLCGMCVLLAVLSFLPLWRAVRAHLRGVCIWSVWLCLFILFRVFSHIAAQITVVAFFGFIGNLGGAVCFRLARLTDRKRREEYE